MELIWTSYGSIKILKLISWVDIFCAFSSSIIVVKYELSPPNRVKPSPGVGSKIYPPYRLTRSVPNLLYLFFVFS